MVFTQSKLKFVFMSSDNLRLRWLLSLYFSIRITIVVIICRSFCWLVVSPMLPVRGFWWLVEWEWNMWFRITTSLLQSWNKRASHFLNFLIDRRHYWIVLRWNRQQRWLIVVGCQHVATFAWMNRINYLWGSSACNFMLLFLWSLQIK